MCFVRISEQTATFGLLNIKRLVFVTEVESVYSAVRTESLYKTDTLRLYWEIIAVCSEIRTPTFCLRNVGFLNGKLDGAQSNR
jgi:hypothetical protein